MITATNTYRRRFFCRLSTLLVVTCLGIVAFGAAGAAADQTIAKSDGTFLDASGNPVTQVGAVPSEGATTFTIGTTNAPGFGNIPKVEPTEMFKDVVVELPPGLVGNPLSQPRRSLAVFVGAFTGQSPCPLESQIGYVALQIGGNNGNISTVYQALWNLGPANGTPAVIGMNIVGTMVFASVKIRTGDDYGVTFSSLNTPYATNLVGAKFALWGAPQDPSLDLKRGYSGTSSLLCASPAQNCSASPHPSSAPNVAFFTMPTSCTTGDPNHNNALETKLSVDSWENPGVFVRASLFTHDNGLPTPQEVGMEGCNALDFSPTLEARPTTNVADSPSGLDVDLHIPARSTETVPVARKRRGPPQGLDRDPARGLVVNPSSANGLGACSEAEFGYTSTEKTARSTPPRARRAAPTPRAWAR